MPHIPAILDTETIDFPNAEFALTDPDGLLAIGGVVLSRSSSCAFCHFKALFAAIILL